MAPPLGHSRAGRIHGRRQQEKITASDGRWQNQIGNLEGNILEEPGIDGQTKVPQTQKETFFLYQIFECKVIMNAGYSSTSTSQCSNTRAVLVRAYKIS